MENNITNQKQSSIDLQIPSWEKPILYSEKWLNTMGGTRTGKLESDCNKGGQCGSKVK